MIRYQRNMEKEISISNDLKEIDRVNQLLEEVGVLMQLPASVTMSTNLAIEEAIANIIRRGYPDGAKGQITLNIKTNSEQFIFLIVDDGESYDPTQNDAGAPLEQWLAKGGGLIRRTMDEISYRTEGGKNYLTLRKSIEVRLQPEATLKINICKIDGVSILAIEGRLDTVNARNFEDAIHAVMEEAAPDIVVNCEGVSYISSSGLRGFMMLQKSVSARKGQLILEGMRPEIKKIFDMTGCSSIFTIR